jgi:hypothetical protein
MFISNNTTPSPCFTPIFLCPFAWILLANLCHLICCSSFQFNALSLTAHLDAARKVLISQQRTIPGGCTFNANYISHYVCIPFISNHVVYLHVFSFFLFYLKMPQWHTKLSNKENNTKINNCSNNLHGGHMHITWVTKSLHINLSNAELNPICHLLALLGVHHFLHVSRIRVKVYDSQFHYPWQNICDSNNTEILPSVASLVTRTRLGRKKKKIMTDNTTPNVPIIILTYVNPYPANVEKMVNS